MDKELNAMIWLELKSRMDSRDYVLKGNKLENVTKMAISLDELDNTNNVKDGKPSNTLFTYYAFSPEYFMHFEPKTPQYKKLKIGNIFSLTLRVSDQNNNVITNGPGTTKCFISNNFFSYFKMETEYRTKLNPEHTLRTAHGIKGTRQTVIVTHNPSKIDQNQLLLVRFPNLGSDDVIIPGMVNPFFNIELSSTADLKKTLVNNVGRAIVKKLAVKFEWNEILSVDDFDVFACYRDLWKAKSEKGMQ